jgi:SAM-dependent methyltransferase
VEAFADFERAGWAGKATDYDRILGRITRRVVDPLLDAARVGAGTRVLDLACGPGYAAARAAGRGAAPVGVDLSPTMVALARARHPALDFREASAEVLPFGPGAFDAVVGNFLVHHLAEPAVALAECARVLAPGGRLALTAWDLPERARFIGVLVDAITEAGSAAPADLPAGPPFFEYSRPEAMTALFTAAGFTGVAVTTVAFEHRVAGAGELWHGLLDGTVRMSALVLAQPPQVRTRIRAAFDRLAARHARDGELWMPVSALVGTGRASSA